MNTPEEQIAAMMKRIQALEDEASRLRLVAEAAIRWHTSNDHLPIDYQAGSSAGDLQLAIETLMRQEGR